LLAGRRVNTLITLHEATHVKLSMACDFKKENPWNTGHNAPIIYKPVKISR
jgi:hypothetical protein